MSNRSNNLAEPVSYTHLDVYKRQKQQLEQDIAYGRFYVQQH